MKIKVLHVVQSLETGGLENGVVNLMNHADIEQFQIDTLCIRDEGELSKRVDKTKAQVFFDGNKDHGFFTGIKKVMTVCKSGDYHIIHSHGLATLIISFVAKILTGVPVIINGEHGVLYLDSVKRRVLHKLLFTMIDLNLTVSTALADEIKDILNFSPKNFKTIINGVDVDRFKPSKAEKIQIRKEFSLTDQHFIIGTVGRLDPVKNYPSLVKGFKDFSLKNDNAVLMIVGAGAEREVLTKQIDALELSGKVILAGERNDIPAIMSAFDIFVLPSLREGLSNTILEAMASGLPIIASHVGGNNEIVKQNYSGYLYPVNEIEKLFAHAQHFYDDPVVLKSFSQNARYHLIDNFSLQKMIENYQITYRELIEKIS